MGRGHVVESLTAPSSSTGQIPLPLCSQKFKLQPRGVQTGRVQSQEDETWNREP